MTAAGVALVVFFATIGVVCVPFLLLVDRIEKRKWSKELDWQARGAQADYNELASRHDALERQYTAQHDLYLNEVRLRLRAEKKLKESFILVHEEVTRALLERAIDPERMLRQVGDRLRSELCRHITEHMEVIRWTNEALETEVFTGRVLLYDLVKKEAPDDTAPVA